MTNFAGATNSSTATLIVAPTSLLAADGAIKILAYNVAGNNSGTSTNAVAWNSSAPQVRAIGRELMYLQPDIIAFNEISTTNGVAQMPDWMNAFLPGYFLATNSIGDGYIQSVIASRFPITRSASHLAFSSLTAFGYGSSSFTRDLFEAQIAVPNWPQPLHIFVSHLKSTGSTNPQDDANKRAAMASAIFNYFATVFLPGINGAHPYVLAGDLNEDAFFPDPDYVSGQPIQRLTSPLNRLQMTIPVNPVSHADLTESIQDALDTRFDYILPCGLLFSNLAGSGVFRTNLLTNLPPNLFSNDDKIASDHLPVLMVFNNPFNTPFRRVVHHAQQPGRHTQMGIANQPELPHRSVVEFVFVDAVRDGFFHHHDQFAVCVHDRQRSRPGKILPHLPRAVKESRTPDQVRIVRASLVSCEIPILRAAEPHDVAVQKNELRAMVVQVGVAEILFADGGKIF